MNIWTILGISPTRDKKEIKKAYHQQLKENHPEENQTAFIQLREVYEEALAYTEEDDSREEVYYEYYEYDGEEEYSDEIDEREQKWLEWCQEVQEVYSDYGKRNNVECWRKLLYDDIPYQIAFYKQCRRYLYRFLVMPNASMYMKREVRLLIDGFFNYSATTMERVKSEKKRELQLIHKKIQLCETIEFDKLIPEEGGDAEVDDFCGIYEIFLEEMESVSKEENQRAEMEQTIRSLEQKKILYLPFECVRIAMHFEDYTEEMLKSRIEALQERWDNAAEIKLLLAQYSIYKGEHSKACLQLRELYREVPAKNYALLYQMAHCCIEAGMYYEAYMLVKQLTWLNPKPFMNEMADNIYAEMEKEYLQKCERKEAISDLEYIHMCRIYLRSNREEDAVKVLAMVKDISKHQWEYEMAHCLVLFYEKAKNVSCCLYVQYEATEMEPIMEVQGAEPIISFLEAYPKERLNSIERLEWEELQARYLFEQRRYSECDRKCNTLLEEYPLSYSILLLRGYADYNKRCFGGWYKLKEYRDFTFLIGALPNRIEARLVSANILMFQEKYEEIPEVLKPIKEKIPDHYAYYELLREKGKKQYFEGILKLFQKSRDCTLSIPPVSKYRLLDLRNVYAEACLDGWVIQDKEYWKKYYDYLEALKDADYNHPDQYMTLFWLYFRTGRQKEAIAMGSERLQNAETDAERHNASDALLRAYCADGDMEGAEKVLAQVSKKTKETLSHDMMVTGHYRAGNYEAAIRYALLEKKRYRGQMELYYYLGKSYARLQQYDEAISTFKEGIRLFDKSGDMKWENFYFEMYKLLIEMKRWGEALDALNDMRMYSRLEDMQSVYDERVIALCYDMIQEYKGREEEKITDIEKVIAKIPKEKEQLRAYPYGILMAAYREAGKTELAIAAARKGIKNSNEVGDYWENNNLYRDLYYIYEETEQHENAIREAKLMDMHTHLESLKRSAPCLIAHAALLSGDFETGYTYFTMINENSNYNSLGLNIEVNLFLCNYGAGHYEELYEQAHKIAYASDDVDIIWLMIAFRCHFMAKGYVNRELGIQIEEEILKSKSLHTKEQKGNYLEYLSEINMALGDTEASEDYRTQAIQYYEEVKDDIDLDLPELTGWCYAYQQRYDKAAQVWEQHPQTLEGEYGNNHIEYAYFKKMSKNSRENEIHENGGKA